MTNQDPADSITDAAFAEQHITKIIDFDVAYFRMQVQSVLAFNLFRQLAIDNAVPPEDQVVLMTLVSQFESEPTPESYERLYSRILDLTLRVRTVPEFLEAVRVAVKKLEERVRPLLDSFTSSVVKDWSSLSESGQG